MGFNLVSFGLLESLTITFLVLKLTNVILWSWWWVFSPMIIGFGLGFIAIVVVILLVIIGNKKGV